MTNPIAAIQKFYGETIEQLKKCSWPTGHELYESTVVVISTLVITTVFVMLADWLCELAVKFITVG